MKKEKLLILIAALALLIFLAGCQSLVKQKDIAKTAETTSEVEPERGADDAIVETMESGEEIKMTSKGVKYIIHPDDFIGGGPPKDGIPSIDDPEYITVEEADKFIADNELVLGINYKGVKRVYPLQIMVWHEIVNDIIAGDPILITYCPLCGTGIAFERTINGEAVEFGVSGKLYNSNLVMYDRKTDTYWQQVEGKAILGELTGMRLKGVSIDTVSWKDWKEANPDSEVLSKKTGRSRPYGRDPYGSYYTDSFIFFPVEHEDRRVHPKTVIFGIEVNNSYQAYAEDDLIEKGTIDDVVGGVNVKVERSKAGVVKITNLDTGEEIIKERGFWFAWYAFHPETTLYGK